MTRVASVVGFSVGLSASALGMAGCGGGSPTTPNEPPKGAIAVTVAPSPVPFSGAASPLESCAGSANTWHWIYSIRETGGVNVTITERIHFVDNVEIRREGGLTVSANSTVQEASSACFADATSTRSYSTRFVGTDANGNAFTYNVPAFQLAARSPFQTIDIASIANAPTGHLSSSAAGSHTFLGVPFVLRSGQQASLITQHGGHPEYPTEATLALSSGSATKVHLLLTGAFVVAIPAGRTVGDISLAFANGAAQTVPIVAWSSIREDWHYTDEPVRTMTPPAPPVSWVNVFEQAQGRAGRPAVGVLDRFTIDVPSNLINVAITSMRIRDTSPATAQSIHPSISVAAITLEYRP